MNTFASISSLADTINQGGGGNQMPFITVSDTFKNLVVPHWAFAHSSMEGGGGGMEEGMEGGGEGGRTIQDAIISDDLYDKLLQLALVTKPKNKSRKSHNNKNKTKKHKQ
jgi:hypothetical protein